MLEDVDAIFGDEDLIVGHVVLERLLQQLTACLDELHRLLLVQVGPRLGPRVRRRRRPELLTDICAHVLDDFERCRRAVLDDVSHQAVVHHGRPVTSSAHAQRRRAGPCERDCGCQHCYRANVPRRGTASPLGKRSLENQQGVLFRRFMRTCLKDTLLNNERISNQAAAECSCQLRPSAAFKYTMEDKRRRQGKHSCDITPALGNRRRDFASNVAESWPPGEVAAFPKPLPSEHVRPPSARARPPGDDARSARAVRRGAEHGQRWWRHAQGRHAQRLAARQRRRRAGKQPGGVPARYATPRRARTPE